MDNVINKSRNPNLGSAHPMVAGWLGRVWRLKTPCNATTEPSWTCISQENGKFSAISSACMASRLLGYNASMDLPACSALQELNVLLLWITLLVVAYSHHPALPCLLCCSWSFILQPEGGYLKFYEDAITLEKHASDWITRNHGAVHIICTALYRLIIFICTHNTNYIFSFTVLGLIEY